MKVSTCLLTGGFIFASIYTMFSSTNNKQVLEFIGTLNPDQLSIYNKILAERSVIYLQGQVLGMMFALFYIFYFRQDTTFNYCMFALITYIITIAYYMITKKQHHMIDHLTNKEQKIALKKSNKSMIITYVVGFILGMIGYILLARIFARIFIQN
jgi:Ca2+/Na+ antiporter